MKTKFEQNLQRELRYQEGTIDAESLQQLASFRQQALDSTRPAPRRFQRFLWPATGMAIASILFVLVMPFSPLGPATVNESVSDNLDLYNDLEFYYWLADTEQNLRG